MEEKEQGYRSCVNSRGLVTFRVAEGESDLLISAKRDLSEAALTALRKCRRELRGYISSHSEFKTSLCPVEVGSEAPSIVQKMAGASRDAGVGPMSAVAGAIADSVGEELLGCSDEVIVENGGDIFITTCSKRVVGVYAGSSPFTGKLRLAVFPEETPAGICTSSGTVGHSLSFGSSDATIVASSSPALADAAATAAGNLVQCQGDIKKALRFARNICGVKGVVIIVGDRVGAWGSIRFEEN